MKSIVYFTKKIEPESLIKLYQKLNVNLEPKIAIKVHAGEEGNQNYIKPDFYKDLVNYLDGVVVECNIAYGGALKQLSIGFASSNGKSYIHSAGKVKSQDVLWDNIASQDKFLESMADAASSVINYFKDNIVYISIMKNISVDCDCCSVAEDPCIPDIGILASTDPVALDKACLDLIYNSNFKGKDHFIERVETRKGKHILDAASKLNLGNLEYELIDIDD